MATQTRKHGFTFMALGTVVLFLTTVYFPYLYHNFSYSVELTWFVLLPIGLIFFVLGVVRVLVDLVLLISMRLK